MFLFIEVSHEPASRKPRATDEALVFTTSLRKPPHGQRTRNALTAFLTQVSFRTILQLHLTHNVARRDLFAFVAASLGDIGFQYDRENVIGTRIHYCPFSQRSRCQLLVLVRSRINAALRANRLA